MHLESPRYGLKWKQIYILSLKSRQNTISTLWQYANVPGKRGNFPEKSCNQNNVVKLTGKDFWMKIVSREGVRPVKTGHWKCEHFTKHHRHLTYFTYHERYQFSVLKRPGMGRLQYSPMLIAVKMSNNYTDNILRIPGLQPYSWIFGRDNMTYMLFRVLVILCIAITCIVHL